MPCPTWISHRGYCAESTENTAEAFRAALDLGFRHLETDLRVTKDGHLVLIHDPDLKRLADKPVAIAQCTRAELEKVKLPGGEGLVFFEQFLEEFAEYHWILDIKSESAIATVDALQKWWQQAEFADFFYQRTRFLFWQQRHQQHLHQRQPDAVCMARLSECRRAGLACTAGLPALAKIKPGASYSLPPKFGGVPVMYRRVVARYHNHGAKVLAYLPETDNEARRAVQAGVDEILTNGRPVDIGRKSEV